MAKKPAAKKQLKKPVAKAPKPAAKARTTKPAAKPVAAKVKPAAPTSVWFDARSAKPVIGEYVKRLDTFLQAMADGRVDADEVRAQEARLVEAMKDVEPRLSADLHGKVTRLLCELTAYDLMQMMYSMQEARPKSVFHG